MSGHDEQYEQNSGNESEAVKTQLLHFYDELNNLVSAQSYYQEAIMSVLSSKELTPLTQRQLNGLSQIGLWITETGENLSLKLESIRDDMNDEDAD